MAYIIEYDPKSVKQLQKLDKSIATDLLDGIEEFADNPVLTKIKKLKAQKEGFYRLKLRGYRVIYKN